MNRLIKVSLGVLLLACLAIISAKAWTKAECATFSSHGLQERYVYGGACGWTDNNAWGTICQIPCQNPPAEGVDCSEFVDRSYAIPQVFGEHDCTSHHYATGSLYGGVSGTVYLGSTIASAKTCQWCFWVSDSYGHCGLIPTWNSTQLESREARGSLYGIVQLYRDNSYYTGGTAKFFKHSGW